MKKYVKFMFLVSGICVLSAYLLGARDFGFRKIARGQTAPNGTVEDLDEIINVRKSRQMENTFYSGEASTPLYYWQPQTLMYKDMNTGGEVWKISNTRTGTRHVYHTDIALQPWSADGKRLGYMQQMLSTQGLSTLAYTSEEGLHAWFIVNTDGSMLRPIPGSPVVCGSAAVFPWSPVDPDAFHWFGETHCGNSSAVADILYKGTVSDFGVSRSELLDLNTNIAMHLFSNSISSDGRKAMVKQGYLEDRFAYKIWPITLYPNPSIDVDEGYTTGRPHDGTYWGTSPETWSTAHSGNVPLINLNGTGNYWYYWVDSYAGGTGFLTKLLGSEPDGGAGHTVDHTGPWTFSDFGENVPIMVGSTGNNPWPDGHYWSHPAFDRWGRYVAYSDFNGSIPYGVSVENISSKTRLITKQGGSSVQHNSWSGWTDYVVSSRGSGGDTGCLSIGYPRNERYTGDRLYIKKYNDDSSFMELVHTHTLFNNDGCYAGASEEYSAIPRPSQSPDGTKVAFHSTFTTAKYGSYDNSPDMFWVVAYYPYPPEIKSAVKDGSNVRLTWDFNQGTRENPNYTNPRTYTKRGWPDETTDLPAAPREIKQFRVWSSEDNLMWVPVGSANYNNCTPQNECGTWTETSWTFDAEQPNGSTRYYAVTSLEHSGLESGTLSNVWKVTLDSNGNIAEQTQETAYPSDPGEKSNFETARPGNPSNVAYAHGQSPATADGQYVISWNAPANGDNVRYYNIYAQDGSEPSAIQQRRIASIPATFDYDQDGAFTYVDWLGNQDGSTQYKVTAVDYQGNESGETGDTTPPAAPSGLNVS